MFKTIHEKRFLLAVLLAFLTSLSTKASEGPDLHRRAMATLLELPGRTACNRLASAFSRGRPAREEELLGWKYGVYASTQSADRLLGIQLLGERTASGGGPWFPDVVEARSLFLHARNLAAFDRLVDTAPYKHHWRSLHRQIGEQATGRALTQRRDGALFIPVLWSRGPNYQASGWFRTFEGTLVARIESLSTRGKREGYGYFFRDLTPP